MIIKENDTMLSVHFGSLVELMDFEPENENNRRQFKELMEGRRRESRKWLGAHNRCNADAVTHALLGDTEAHAIAVRRMGTLKEKASVKTAAQVCTVAKRVKRKRDFGDELDIHKVYQGNISQAWTKTERIEFDKKHHLVTLFININGRCNVEFDETIWRSSVAMKLIEDIQKAGKSVQVVVGGFVAECMAGSRKGFTFSVVVKKYNETLTPERLTAMTSIAFYRTFGFASKRCQNLRVQSGEGFSYETNANKNVSIHLKEEIELGHTKPIFIKGITNEGSAKMELANAYAQMASLN